MRTCSILALHVLPLLSGCRLFGGGKSVVKLDRESPAPMTVPAPASGSYVLCAVGNRSPIITFKLQEGEAIGFGKDDAGRPVAVAGHVEIPLDPHGKHSWYWRLK